MGGCGRVLVSLGLGLVLFSGSSTASPLIEDPSAALQDMIYSIQSQDPMGGGGGGGETNSRLLANLVEMARRRGDDLEDPESPLRERLLEALHAKEGYTDTDLPAKADKRASYMSLCHFKICNMGRKRTPWNMWPRA